MGREFSPRTEHTAKPNCMLSVYHLTIAVLTEVKNCQTDPIYSDPDYNAVLCHFANTSTNTNEQVKVKCMTSLFSQIGILYMWVG